MEISKEKFFQKYNINPVEFKETNLNWDSLLEIYHDFCSKQNELEKVANHVFNMLIDVEKVHSLRKRVKDAEHLIEKIIRKKFEKNKEVTLENYEEIVTDLIGVRILHLFKEDWEIIHSKILEIWDLKENPTANIKKGDKTHIYEKYDCKIKEHKFGYGSVHYLIEFPYMKNKNFIVEIQVRTVFEEAWSEIDHSIRYPYDIDNPILAGYLVMFNTLSGNADEMGTFIKFLKRELDDRKHKMILKDRTINDLRKKIDELEIENFAKELLLDDLEKISGKNNDYDVNTDFINSIDWMPSIGSMLKLDSDVIQNLANISEKLTETLGEDVVHPILDNINSNVYKLATEIANNFDQIAPIIKESGLLDSQILLTSETSDTLKAVMEFSENDEHIKHLNKIPKKNPENENDIKNKEPE